MEQCVGCWAIFRKYKDEPCCRCDILAERAGRLLDDPTLTLMHEAIMEMAMDWTKASGMARHGSRRGEEG